MRRAGPLLIFLVLAAASLLAPLDGASAHAPTCKTRSGNSPVPGTPTEAPWAQARLGAGHLAGLATGDGITVAVIDSGVDRANRALGKVLGGGDLLDPTGDGRLDCVGHGTAVASLINGDVYGLAPKATVLSIRVTEQEEVDGTTVGRTSGSAGLATAIRRAVDLGARVINLSLVSYTDNAQVRAAVADAVAHDVVVVAAVGNRAAEGNPTPYPAAYNGVLGVGAVGMDGRRLAGSQVGRYVDLVAPGAQIVAAGVPGGFTVHEGTSFATPFVAATAALVREYRPELTATQVVDRLLATADEAPAGPGSPTTRNPTTGSTETGTTKTGSPATGGPTAGDPKTGSPEYGRGLLNPYRALTNQLIPAAPAPASAKQPANQRAGQPAGTNHKPALAIAGVALGLAALAVLVALTRPKDRRHDAENRAKDRRYDAGK